MRCEKIDWLGSPQCRWVSFGRINGRRAWSCQTCGHNSLTKDCPLTDDSIGMADEAEVKKP